MNNPVFIYKHSFQDAWLEAIKVLSSNHWELFNLIVQIQNPILFDQANFVAQTHFSNSVNIRRPKDVAYTIFPYGLYTRSANELYHDYITRFYPWTRKREHSGWGTYFYRMINYVNPNNPNARPINQLERIINAINARDRISSSAYTILIPIPGPDTIRPLGSPCLNSICIQIERGSNPKINLLALYRNHEFLERAYGNYFGLCKLLLFICKETGYDLGVITCISSHAYIAGHITEIRSTFNV